MPKKPAERQARAVANSVTRTPFGTIRPICSPSVARSAYGDRGHRPGHNQQPGGGIQRRARAAGAQPVWRAPHPQRGKRGQGRPRRGGSHRPRTAGDAAPGYRRALQTQDGHRRGVQPGRAPLHAGSAVRVRHRPAGGGTRRSFWASVWTRRW